MNVTPEIQETRHRAASKIRRSMASSRAVTGSAKTDNPLSELKTITARAHAAFRDNLIAGAAIGSMDTGIIGTGLAPRPTVNFAELGLTRVAANELNKQIRAYFDGWAENASECDIERIANFYQIQSLVLVSSLVSGDVFVSTPAQLFPGHSRNLKMQVIDGARVNNENGSTNTETLHDGVEFAGSAPKRYHIQTKHPSDVTSSASWEKLDVFGAGTGRRRVMHVWNERTRPGQVRGVSFLAPILEPLQLLDRWSASELTAAVVGSMFAVFLEKEKEATGTNVPAIDGMDDNQQLALEPGSILDLAPGEKAVFANPTRPSENFDPFFQSICKQIGARLQIPLQTLLLHFDSSYSAARAAMLQAWRFFRVRKSRFVQQFLQPVYELIVDEGVASGALNLPGYADPKRRMAYCRAIWTGDGRGAIDELKEAQAMEKRIAIGVTNLDIETMQYTGESYEDVLAQRAVEIAAQDAVGIRDSARGPAPPDPVIQTPEEPAPNNATPNEGDE